MAADPGASHAKRGRPSPATLDLLARSHATLRDELSDLLVELRPPAANAPIEFGKPAPKGRPSLEDRGRLVALIGKVMDLLGSEIVATPAPEDPASSPRPRRRRIDYG